MANNQIRFDVGFNFNKSDLNTLTTALKNIQSETISVLIDFLGILPCNRQGTGG